MKAKTIQANSRHQTQRIGTLGRRKLVYKPTPAANSNNKFHRKLPFLKAYIKFRVKHLAANAAGVDRNTVNAWIQDDPNFAAAMVQCDEIITEQLESAAYKRAIKKSDVLMSFLLRARDRKKYGDQVDIKLDGTFSLRAFYTAEQTKQIDDRSAGSATYPV